MRVLKIAADEALTGADGARLRWSTKSGATTYYRPEDRSPFHSACRCGEVLVVEGKALVDHSFEPNKPTPDARFDEAGCPPGYDLECAACARPQRWIYSFSESPPWSSNFIAEVAWVYVPRDP